MECSELTRDRRGRDRMVVGFTIFITETFNVQKLECSELTRDRRGRDRMVVGFTIYITETCECSELTLVVIVW